MKPQEAPLPLVRCADEYFSTFGNPFEGTKMLKGLGLAILIMLVGNTLLAFAEAAGLMWLAAILIMIGGAIAVGVYYLKRHPRGGVQAGESSAPGISRAYYFRSLACPHCGKPVGSTFSKQLILHLRCVHCGGEAKTDCSMMNGSLVSKV